VRMQLELNDHPSVEVLEEYCFKRLPPAILEPVEEHLLVCETCRETVRETDEFILLMKFAIAEGAADAPRMPAAHARDNLTETSKKSSLGSVTIFTALTLASLTALVWGATSFRTNPPGPVIPVRLVAMRGGENTAFPQAPAGRPLELAIDTTELPAPDSYRVEIVSSTGPRVWTSPAPLSGREILARTPTIMKAGVYWVRLYSSQSDSLVREYGLKLE
jgi:hypothetical protein